MIENTDFDEKDLESVSRVKEIRDRIEGLYAEYVTELNDISALLRAKSDLSDGAMADCGGILKDAHKLAVEIGRDLNARINLVSKILCARLARSPDFDRSNFVGLHYTAIPKYKEGAAKLNVGSDKYQEFCEYLKIPKELIETGLFEFGYVRVQNWIEKQRENCHTVPEFLDTYPIFTCTYRKRKTTDG